MARKMRKGNLNNLTTQRMKYVNETLLAIITIGFSIFFQVHCAIHGFDLTDEGYLMSIYQWFGTDVQYAQGAGGYPLTCYLGSLLNSVFPEGGILGMRLWGILVVVVTQLILYFYLRRYFNPKMVLLGLLIQAIFVSGDPKPFGYNTLTALMTSVAMITLIEGTLHDNKLQLFIAGLLFGGCVFFRIPNITCLSFLIVPYILDFKGRRDRQLRKSTVFVTTTLFGFVVSFTATWAFLVHIGADVLVTDLIASIGDTLNGTSTHASSSLVSKYISNLLLSIQTFTIFILAIVICSLTQRFRHPLVFLLLLFVSFQLVYRNTYMSSSMLGDTVLAMMNGIGLFGSCYFLTQGNVYRGIAMSAMLFSLVIPLGSDGGYQTMWVGTWFSLPIGLAGLYDLTGKSVGKRWTANCVVFPTNMPDRERFHFVFDVPNMRMPFYFCLVIFVLATFVKIERKPYYDPGNRLDKTYTIESPMAKGIYTVESRAKVINPLLKELNNHVAKGDTLLVYDSSPLIYYLTQTKPFAGISWPCVFYGQQYVDKFKAAEARTEHLPILVLQNFYSSNEWSEPKYDYYNLKADGSFSSKEMSQNIMDFIERNHYRRVWTNEYYDILVPNDK